MNAVALQMSATLGQLARRAHKDSQWIKLAREAGLEWSVASEMTFAAFTERLANVRRGLVPT